MEKIHDLSYEMKFVNIIGYKLKQEENNFIILDENDKEVGFIRTKKIYKGKEKKYGYEMYINSSLINYHSLRSEDDKKTSYEFTVKDDNNTKVEIDLGNDKLLTIWSNNSFSNLNLNNYRLYLHLQSNTDNYKTEETFIYSKKANKGFQYSYQIDFSHKENKKDKGMIEVSGYETDPNHLKITDISWFYGHSTRATTTEVEGTIEDMNKKYHYGIDLFKHYHYLVRSLLPFENDILEEIFTDDIIEEKGLESFMPKKNKLIRSEAKVTSEEYNKVFARNK